MTGVASFALPALPFGPNALWPLVSPKLIALHWEVLHAGYLQRWRTASLTKPRGREKTLAFNRNGAVLHDLWWHNLSEQREDPPDGSFHGRVGDTDKLEDALIKTGLELHGSGWACLSVKKAGKRRWEPMVHAVENHSYDWASPWKPLILVDVFEHAYWPDQTDKAKYLEGIVRAHLDWRAADVRLEMNKKDMLTRTWLFEDSDGAPPWVL